MGRMDSTQLQRALHLAQEVAMAPSAMLLAAFRSRAFRVETKSDGSPVTELDRRAEAVMRAVIRMSPEFGHLPILGEEAGLEGEAAVYQWLLDPIDGTVSYTRGIPTFGTIVALEDTVSGQALVGVIHHPHFGETYAAARGLGSWCQGQRLQVSSATDLRTALVSAPDAYQFHRTSLDAAHQRLWQACDHLRGYTDCWAHTQAARGIIDAVVEPMLNTWDIRATQVLIEEAGGKQITRPSAYPGALDAIFGCPALVDQLADLVYGSEAR
ncbi:inositol monophosphatase family protein [Candidatus Entotheonella palauensis]|nr:inositol monophosphatase family protein [Candidatus Entotheonella palauensis]